MKRLKYLFVYAMIFFSALNFMSCGCIGCSAIELMGAGDRIHDSYTFANVGVKIKEEKENYFVISGSVEKLTDSNVKQEFKIDEDIDYVVAIKLTAINSEVDKENVTISVNGIRSYDAEHLNASDYTFVILEAVPGVTVSINVKWNKDAEEKTYFVKFADDLNLR